MGGIVVAVETLGYGVVRVVGELKEDFLGGRGMSLLIIVVV